MPLPARAPSVIAAFMSRPVSSTMPNVPSASPAGDIFARAPYAASSKSWMRRLP